MSERKYSVSEIDRMRQALLSICGMDRDFLGPVEEQLRTYMLNGTDPEELEQRREEQYVTWTRMNEEALRERGEGDP